MIEDYDPAQGPDAALWLRTPERVRRTLVELAHEANAWPTGEHAGMHALMHLVVENQVAGDLPAVSDVLARLVREGLDRHDAVHAIGSVLATSLWRVMRGDQDELDEETYVQALAPLTADGWRAQAVKKPASTNVERNRRKAARRAARKPKKLH
jgi:hypothetical protein